MKSGLSLNTEKRLNEKIGIKSDGGNSLTGGTIIDFYVP